jgi:hypothetical protein
LSTTRFERPDAALEQRCERLARPIPDRPFVLVDDSQRTLLVVLDRQPAAGVHAPHDLADRPGQRVGLLYRDEATVLVVLIGLLLAVGVARAHEPPGVVEHRRRCRRVVRNRR